MTTQEKEDQKELLEILNQKYKEAAANSDRVRALMVEGKKSPRAWQMACNKAHKAFLEWFALDCKITREEKESNPNV